MSDVFLRAYYHTFDTTGEHHADQMLSAVARASKAYHNTGDWEDEEWGSIQNAANETAKYIAELEEENKLLSVLEAVGVDYSLAREILAEQEEGWT